MDKSLELQRAQPLPERLDELQAAADRLVVRRLHRRHQATTTAYNAATTSGATAPASTIAVVPTIGFVAIATAAGAAGSTGKGGGRAVRVAISQRAALSVVPRAFAR